jgi:hypothetical protein
MTGVVESKAASRDESESVFAKLHQQYADLSPKGKLVTGVAVGFVGSRLALGTVTKVVKIGAGAFIAYVQRRQQHSTCQYPSTMNA